MATPVILAAGASERFGSPKALADFDGRTALSLILDTCRRAGCAGTVLVLGSAAREVAASLCANDDAALIDRDGGQVVLHEGWAAGQTSSLKAGLKAALGAGAKEKFEPTCDVRHGPSFLLFTVDCPLVRAETVRELIDSLASAPERVRIVVPAHEGRRGHPVLFDASVAAEFLALGDGDPAHRVVRKDSARVLVREVDDPGIVDDIDTPDRYRRALARWRAGGTAAPGQL